MERAERVARGASAADRGFGAIGQRHHFLTERLAKRSKKPKALRERAASARSPIDALAPYDDEGHLRVVVETPKDSAIKLTWDSELGLFVYSRALTLGLRFPFDFGFVPGTLAEDGDPLDALVLHTEATFPGVVIACEPIAVIEVEQREKDERIRNDRVIAIPAGERKAQSYSKADVDTRMRREVEEFFKAATLFEGKELEIVGWSGPRAVEALVAKLERTR
jgi:inorganic pyrophosphatase